MLRTQTVHRVLRNAGLVVMTMEQTHREFTKGLHTAQAETVSTRGACAVINAKASAELGYGCFGHPRYDELTEQLTRKIEEALTSAKIPHVRSHPKGGQLIVGDYIPVWQAKQEKRS